MMPLASTSATEPVHASTLPPYRVQATSSSPAYRMPSPQAPVRGEPSYPAPSSLATRSPQTAYRLPPAYPQQRPSRGMPSPPTAPRVPSPAPPLSSSSRLPETRLPSSRRASLSLAAITTPYAPEPHPYGQPQSQQQQQPKNRRAQTLPSLGQRLRTASVPTGPAAGPRRRRVRRNSCSTDTSLAREAGEEEEATPTWRACRPRRRLPPTRPRRRVSQATCWRMHRSSQEGRSLADCPRKVATPARRSAICAANSGVRGTR